jgi:hypothetical protein
MEQPAEIKNSVNVKSFKTSYRRHMGTCPPQAMESEPAMKCNERDETERDIPLMDLLDRWELPHKIQDSRSCVFIKPVLWIRIW